MDPNGPELTRIKPGNGLTQGEALQWINRQLPAVWYPCPSVPIRGF